VDMEAKEVEEGAEDGHCSRLQPLCATFRS
jgi:hypothetical protein